MEYGFANAALWYVLREFIYLVGAITVSIYIFISFFIIIFGGTRHERRQALPTSGNYEQAKFRDLEDR
jgi:hypothetical protein